MNDTSDIVELIVGSVIDMGIQEPRSLVAISGPPAAGKSTLATAVAAGLTEAGTSAVVVPMDGFHLDNRVLDSRGLRHCKGAPETFDSDGFLNAMRRLFSEEEVLLPDFDRARDVSVAGAISVERHHRVAVVEGNYLCSTLPVWRKLRCLWAMSVHLDLPPPILHARLVQRWKWYGLTPEAAEWRASGNDSRNADTVRRTLGHPDLVIGPCGAVSRRAG